MAAKLVRYDVPGWGVGELWLDRGTVLWHELPRAGREPEGSHPLTRRLRAWFAGRPDGFEDVRLDLEELTPFGLALSHVLRGLPRGEVVSYGELAALAGRPGAARAAGTFCARNRLGLFVPCHRVVGAHGIGSYGSLGLEYKRRLLELEGASL